MIELINSDFS